MAVSCCGYFKRTALPVKEASQHGQVPLALGTFPWLYQSSGFGWSSKWMGLIGAEVDPTCPCDPVIYGAVEACNGRQSSVAGANSSLC